MAVYAIGDIQGCFDELLALLERLEFDENRDRLWLTGDLVNRGPKSLEVLRFVKDLGERVVTVLGNHDLHLLAVAHKLTRSHRRDSLYNVLRAEDGDVLLDWLRQRPLLHHDLSLGFTLIHAGLPPQWDLEKARACAAEVETVLRGADFQRYLAEMYGDEPKVWSEGLTGWERLRFITNCLTRLRFCDEKGLLALGEKGPPGSQPPSCLPWFEIPWRRSRGLNIVFGHWSTLGDYPPTRGTYPLDTGCIWGGKLTALCLENLERFSIPCSRHQKIY